MSLNFSFSPEQEAVRDTVRRLCQEELAALVAQAEETETFPRQVFKRWGALGLLGVRYPEADGGSGLDKVSDCIVREELSYMSQAFASSWSARAHSIIRRIRIHPTPRPFRSDRTMTANSPFSWLGSA